MSSPTPCGTRFENWVNVTVCVFKILSEPFKLGLNKTSTFHLFQFCELFSCFQETTKYTFYGLKFYDIKVCFMHRPGFKMLFQLHLCLHKVSGSLLFISISVSNVTYYNIWFIPLFAKFGNPSFCKKMHVILS